MKKVETAVVSFCFLLRGMLLDGVQSNDVKNEWTDGVTEIERNKCGRGVNNAVL